MIGFQGRDGALAALDLILEGVVIDAENIRGDDARKMLASRRRTGSVQQLRQLLRQFSFWPIKRITPYCLASTKFINPPSEVVTVSQ